MTRSTRHVALVLVLALGVALAGCTGGGTPTAPPGDADGGGGGGDQAGSNDDDGDSDGGDAGGDGDDGQSGANGGDDTPRPTAGAPGRTATQAPTATATPTATPNATGPATDRLPTLGEVLEPADSFRYRIDIDQIDGNAVDFVQEGRYHEGDIYAEVNNEQGTSEVYVVDGQNYVVTGGVCQQVSAGGTQNPGNTTQPGWANESLRPTGTTTLDGQEVYVYESDAGPPRIGGPTTIYVSVESGHVVRQEAPNFVSETWEFGNVDPVEAPC